LQTATGTTVLEYVDKAGKVIKQSAEMLPYDAQLQAKALKKAVTAAGSPGGGGQNATSTYSLATTTELVLMNQTMLGLVLTFLLTLAISVWISLLFLR